MTVDQGIVFGILTGALILFMGGRPRYDVVALLALLAAVFADIVEPQEAFLGFGHPAVVTVAAVLIVSRALRNSGVADVIAGWLSRVGDRAAFQVPALTGAVVPFSAFINNVGALALLMPVAIELARKAGNPPSRLLMPLAFGSLLGGLTTLIGTPPNIIIATIRAESGGDAFRMFDFTPVGLGVAVAGGIFVSTIGWRLLPVRKGQRSPQDLFRIEDYLTEVRVPEDSKIADKRIRELVGGDVVVVTLVRGETVLPAPTGFEIIQAGDILIVEADPDAIKSMVDDLGLELVGGKSLDESALGSDEISVAEAVVMPDSLMVGRTPIGLNLRWRYGINLLAVARSGERLGQRLKRVRFQPGDVLLLQGRSDTLREAFRVLGCLPLAGRDLRIGQPRRLLLSLAIFVAAIAAAALGLIDVQIAFMTAALTMVLAGMLSVREAYEAIDWPVIILLGAMIPVGQAIETTGGAELIAERLLEPVDDLSPVIAIAVVLIVVMLLSDVVNNAAAAVVMAPVAIGIARGLEASVDPFLMAVAVGASCAFLTPIGHQSNTLVMGPGGYRFGDYWRMGLPLEVIIVAVAVPLIVLVWPP